MTKERLEGGYMDAIERGLPSYKRRKSCFNCHGDEYWFTNNKCVQCFPRSSVQELSIMLPEKKKLPCWLNYGEENAYSGTMDKYV